MNIAESMKAELAAWKNGRGIDLQSWSVAKGISAPARAIQELAGHQDLGTPQRYMHLSPAALDAAIRLVEAADTRGGIVEAPEKLG